MRRALISTLALMAVSAALLLSARDYGLFFKTLWAIPLSLAILAVLRKVRWRRIHEQTYTFRLKTLPARTIGLFLAGLFLAVGLVILMYPLHTRFQAGARQSDWDQHLRDLFSTLKRQSGLPQPVFQVSRSTALYFKETEPHVIEELRIVPKQNFSIVDVKLAPLGNSQDHEQTLPQISARKRVHSGMLNSEPLWGMDVVIRHDKSLPVEQVGFLTSKLVVAPTQVVLVVENLSEERPSGKPRHSQEWTADARISEEWVLIAEFPKETFLAAFPDSRPSQRPDRDIITIMSGYSGAPVEVYFLRTLRFEPVRLIVQSTLGSNTVIRIAQWLFWPALVGLAALIRETIKQRVVGFFGRKKKRHPIGFQPPRDPKSRTT